ncbi:MAG: putative lipoprotein [Acidobacteria bacterium]|nr:putative lipoprotein [Acidobacteriota bacterium]
MKVRTALLILFALSACKLTTPPPLRGTKELPVPITLEALESRGDATDVGGGKLCSDILFRDTSIERFVDRNGKEFNLGVIEISDNGHVADDVQKKMVLERIRQTALGGKDTQGQHVHGAPGAIIITFVHGWHHRSKVCDNNLACFRRVLQALSEAGGQGGRPVFGVYIGWRGDTVEKASFLSFYNRKSTAHLIGHEGGREVLLDLDQLYRGLNDRIGTPDRPHPVTMVTAGHSFGGALVYSAVEGALVRQLRNPNGKGSVLAVGEAAVDCNGAKVRPVRSGIGDLVVLVNPAFEATRYQQFVDDERTAGRYDEKQLPVLLTVASEGDSAVKVAVPVGRSLYFSAFPWRWRHMSDIIGAGHYDPQTTHDLVVVDDANTVVHPAAATRPKVEPADADTTARCHLKLNEGDLATCKCEYEVPALLTERAENADLTLASGTVRTAKNEKVSLRPRTQRDPHSPYIVVRVAPEIISQHSDIYTPRFITFLTAYISEFLERSTQVKPASVGEETKPCTPMSTAAIR